MSDEIDYNDGEIHAWSGGECPVHPKSTIDATIGNGWSYGVPADKIFWSQPLLFRVIDQHVEPRPRYYDISHNLQNNPHAVATSDAPPPNDLTAIEVPFGLLNEATQQALEDDGGPYEVFGVDSQWVTCSDPSFLPAIAYRKKPAPQVEPPKPLELWVNVYPSGNVSAYRTAARAADWLGDTGRTVHMREVPE